MEKLKSFKSFVKENKADLLDNQIMDTSNDEVLMNVKDLPSELWDEEMINIKMESISDDADDNIDDDMDVVSDTDDKMIHKINGVDDRLMVHKKIDNDIVTFSEKEDYILKDVFDENR